MKFLNSNRLRSAVIFATGLMIGMLSTVNKASAFPVIAPFVNDDRCDNPGNMTLTDELGGTAANNGQTAAPFPIDEWISWSVLPAGVVCTGTPGGNNDWEVTITNQTSRRFSDLFFVTDAPGNNTVGNADGKILGFDAFRIDGTVTKGVNDNLLSESIKVDEIFEPGEVWKFLVSDFVALNNSPVLPVGAPFFGSLGVGSVSLESNASIVAKPIPEPTSTVGFLALFTMGVTSIVQRKLKPFKSTEKDSTNIS